MRAPVVTKLASVVAMIAMIASIGCGSMYTYRFPLNRNAPPTSGVEVYWEGQLPSGGIEELEMVEAIGGGTHANVGDVVEAMQGEAIRYGANALVRVRVDCGHGSCHGYGVAVRFVKPPS